MTDDPLSTYVDRDVETLTEYEARSVFREYGVPCPREVLLEYDETKRSGEYYEEFAAHEDAPEFPLYLKVAARGVTSVSDAGGVKRVGSPDEFVEAIPTMLDGVQSAAPDAGVQGVIAVEDRGEEARELVLGGTDNPQFGTVLSVGVGGIYVEVYGDVEFRPLPVGERDVRSMLSNLQGRALLDEFRGMDPVDVDAVVDAAVSFATMLEDNPGIAEAEANPLLVGPEGAVAADALIRLE